MDANEAAAALRDAEGYEEGLTQRTAGMTNVVWGLASPLIFLTYAAASDLVVANDLQWMMALLWIPGVLLGGTLTSLLWGSHAVSLQVKVTAKAGLRHMGVNVVVFLALAAMLFAASTWAGLDWTMSVIMTLVNGVFAFIVARREASASLACSRHTTVAAAFMVLAAIGIGLSGWGESGAALGGAGVTAIGWAGSGLWTYVRS